MAIKPGSRKGLLVNLFRAIKNKRWRSAYFISDKIKQRKPSSKQGFESPFETKASSIHIKYERSSGGKNGRLEKSKYLF